MSLKLYAHPFSSYSQKALIALYENAIPFEYRMLEDADAAREWTELWPIKRFPVLVDGERTVFEATAIIEYLDARHPGPVRMIAGDGVETRMLDRFFDNYVHHPMQKIVLDHLRPEGQRDAYGVGEAREMLDRAYAWLDQRMAGQEWAVDGGFGMADCAAAPALFYADWVHPIGDSFAQARAYRQRLLARPSIARAVDEGRPYRSYFPPGAPDRD
ncbi:glutathione S-transferase family protein [Pseudoxanthomonas helianthi]|uniref:Glutathione S-transferase family protein n=1 Tax=Pseudoxanthomonas helianthi TaxID=1453541 RepID=A0A941AS83_9GAMM|nr:glutathione S-transferase family protein [Pseudoxanthomonas helianthi]MBP3982952.1 glutathione S-transferase family protein [Pseudoxanthomonas helianthi]